MARIAYTFTKAGAKGNRRASQPVLFYDAETVTRTIADAATDQTAIAATTFFNSDTFVRVVADSGIWMAFDEAAVVAADNAEFIPANSPMTFSVPEGTVLHFLNA